MVTKQDALNLANTRNKLSGIAKDIKIGDYILVLSTKPSTEAREIKSVDKRTVVDEKGIRWNRKDGTVWGGVQIQEYAYRPETSEDRPLCPC